MTGLSGSNPSVAGERKGSSREDTLAIDLLRLLTIAKMGNSPKQGQKDRPADREGEEMAVAKKQWTMTRAKTYVLCLENNIMMRISYGWPGQMF